MDEVRGSNPLEPTICYNDLRQRYGVTNRGASGAGSDHPLPELIRVNAKVEPSG